MTKRERGRPLTRSEIMSRVRTRDTKPELLLRKALWRLGLRYRLRPILPGKPDLVFRRERVAIFIDGCYWHGCPRHFKVPGTNADFWEKKINRNKVRDREVDEILKTSGWRPLRIWEHDILRNPEQAVARIRETLDPFGA